MVHVVLLSGGSGMRLWPLSNNTRSKQFLKVLRDQDGIPVSMVQRAFAQIKKARNDLDITIATSKTQQAAIEAQLDGAYALVLEPERRDTAPAIMLACAHLYYKQRARSDDIVLVMPIDTYADQTYFDSACSLDGALMGSGAEIALLGVEPTYPSEKYGYIVPTSRKIAPYTVGFFKEKPERAFAEELIEKGALWNCGVFAFRLEYAKNLWEQFGDYNDFDTFLRNYTAFPKTSFDYFAVENAESIVVAPYSGEWKDLGTWNTLSEEMAEPYSGRVVVEDETCTNIHVINETELPMVVAGLHDSVVIATPDGILVSGKDESASLKHLVTSVAEKRPMYEKRQWGEYRVLESGIFPEDQKVLVKELRIYGGRQLSYQRHAWRSELWTVVSGEGEVALDDRVVKIKPTSTVSIKAGQLHSVRAFDDLYIIEVQTGSILEEEDIERFGYYWR